MVWVVGKCLRGLGDLGRSAQDTMDDNGFHLVYHFQTIPLSFTFQFYGHEINQVTIATGGRLFPVAAAQGNFGQQLHLLLLLKMTVSIDDGLPRRRIGGGREGGGRKLVHNQTFNLCHRFLTLIN